MKEIKMPKIRISEQEARRAAARADFEAIKPYINLFRKAVLVDPAKTASADAAFDRLTDSQKDMAMMVVFRMTSSGKFRGALK